MKNCSFFMLLATVLNWILWKSFVLSKVIVDVHETPYECDDTLPLPAADFSGLEFELDEDDVMNFSGTVNVTEDYEAPIGMNLHTEHLERGEWKTGIMSRVVRDFCPVILNRFEAWYPITKTLQQTECPYRKGHIERFDHLKLGTFGVAVPHHLLGEWKVYFEITAKRNGQTVKECIMRRADLIDG
ncbi:hypothetical protein pipiens_001666 [Culex pipiens pipiens]|uniref:MD-2-related lipid-recognition domain-containing protein n=1 Tax=Culex pipiens pipiens TaxID=38569 RepID=A0ABD1CCG6_CULPP